MKRLFATFVFVLLSCLVTAQTLCGQVTAANQLSAPRVGVVRYANGGVYVLYGLPGSYVVGPRVLAGTDGVSFSERGGLVVRKGLLTLLRSDFSTAGIFESGESNPLVNITGDLATAIAWLPSTQRLVFWNGQAFAAVSVPDLSQEGEVSFGCKHDDQTATLLLHSPNDFVSEASVSLKTGQVISITAIAGAHGRSLLHQSLLLSPENRDFVVTALANGSTKKLSLAAGDLRVETVASDCLHLQSLASQRDWLLHFRGDNFELTELPPPPSSSIGAVK